MDLKIGFIGAGNMATALAKGFLSEGHLDAPKCHCSAPTTRNLSTFKEMKMQTSCSNCTTAQNCDIIILAVKPHILPSVLTEIKPYTADKLVISVVSGVSLRKMKEELHPRARIVRTMPNTPCLVKCGATVYTCGEGTKCEDAQLVEKLFNSVGVCHQVDEPHIDIATGLSGSGPAYMFVAMEALADGAVRKGLPRETARSLAAQMVMGAGKLALESPKHTAELKDGVTSPGGTTIAGLFALEKGGFRASLMDAVSAATDRAKELGQTD